MAFFRDAGADFVCFKCRHAMTAGERFCPACGADREIELTVEALERSKLASCRRWILGIGFIYFVSALVYIYTQEHHLSAAERRLILGSGAGLCLLHVGLFFWARVAPLAAAVVALLLFLSLQLVNAVDDPSTIYSGIVIKVLFLSALLKGVHGAYEIHRLREERT